MNNDLISRDALKLTIENFQIFNPKLSVYDVLKIIDNAPTVNPTYPLPEDVFLKITDAEWEHSDTVCITTPSGKKIELEKKRPHGKWLYIDNEWGTFQCDQCKKHSSINYYFCPNCGADMRGDRE